MVHNVKASSGTEDTELLSIMEICLRYLGIQFTSALHTTFQSPVTHTFL